MIVASLDFFLAVVHLHHYTHSEEMSQSLLRLPQREVTVLGEGLSSVGLTTIRDKLLYDPRRNSH